MIVINSNRYVIVSSPKHICLINKVTTKEICALPFWVEVEAKNLYVVKICMDKKKKKKTQKSDILGTIVAHDAQFISP